MCSFSFSFPSPYPQMSVLTHDPGLLYTQSWNASALQTQDVPNAIKATMQRKKPTFSKL